MRTAREFCRFLDVCNIQFEKCMLKTTVPSHNCNTRNVLNWWARSGQVHSSKPKHKKLLYWVVMNALQIIKWPCHGLYPQTYDNEKEITYFSFTWLLCSLARFAKSEFFKLVLRCSTNSSTIIKLKDRERRWLSIKIDDKNIKLTNMKSKTRLRSCLTFFWKICNVCILIIFGIFTHQLKQTYRRLLSTEIKHMKMRQKIKTSWAGCSKPNSAIHWIVTSPTIHPECYISQFISKIFINQTISEWPSQIYERYSY